MGEMHPELQEDLNESAIEERNLLIKQKQHVFEKNQIQENKENLKEKPPKTFKSYVPWIVAGAVLIFLVFLIFIFDLI